MFISNATLDNMLARITDLEAKDRKHSLRISELKSELRYTENRMKELKRDSLMGEECIPVTEVVNALVAESGKEITVIESEPAKVVLA